MAINVFHIVSDKEWAGAEQYVYDLASELRAHGAYIEIVTRNRRQILNRFRELEVPISILPLKGLTDIESALRFARLIKRGKNIVHVHNAKDAATALLARKISENKNTRVVMTCHTVAKPKRGPIYKRVYREIDKIIFVSELAKTTFLESRSGMNPDRITVIHNSVHHKLQNADKAIDLRLKLNIPADKRLIMFHGRIAPEKGVSVLLRALTQLDKERYHLVIIGAGETKYMGEIKAFIVANQLLRNVTFLGYQDDVQPLLAQCDFGVLPSVWKEPFGLTNLEYMMLGKAHIATTNGAQHEYVKDGRTGILVSPDNYRSLADAIEHLLDDPERCNSIGAAAKEEFDNRLCYSRFYSHLTSVYRSLF